MKNIGLTIILLMSACTVYAGVPSKDPKIESKIDNLLSKMTLEEKAGQMIQLVTDLFGGNDKKGVFHIDEHKTDSIFSRYKVGSILNAPNTVAPTAKAGTSPPTRGTKPTKGIPEPSRTKGRRRIWHTTPIGPAARARARLTSTSRTAS